MSLFFQYNCGSYRSSKGEKLSFSPGLFQVFIEFLNENSWKTTPFWLKGYEVLSGGA